MTIVLVIGSVAVVTVVGFWLRNEAKRRHREWRRIYERLAATTNYLAKLLAELEQIRVLIEASDTSDDGD